MLISYLFRDSDFAKQITDAFKVIEKKHPKRVSGLSSNNARLIEDALLPMIIAQDVNSGEIVA